MLFVTIYKAIYKPRAIRHLQKEPIYTVVSLHRLQTTSSTTRNKMPEIQSLNPLLKIGGGRRVGTWREKSLHKTTTEFIAEKKN